jgi:hypothetical protein
LPEVLNSAAHGAATLDVLGRAVARATCWDLVLDGTDQAVRLVVDALGRDHASG